MYFLWSVLCRPSVKIKLFFVVSDLLTVCEDKLLNIGKGKRNIASLRTILIKGEVVATSLCQPCERCTFILQGVMFTSP